MVTISLITTRKENQRTLAFNVAIQDLPPQKTVFSGSSSDANDDDGVDGDDGDGDDGDGDSNDGNILFGCWEAHNCNYGMWFCVALFAKSKQS